MINDILEDAKSRMNGAIESVRKEYGSIRTGRANISIFDDIMVDYCGSELPINQVASLSAPEARMLVIQPWDKGAIEPIEKAITSSGLGLNPQNDGAIIRIPIPVLTEERRLELVKHAKKKAEEGKISVRNVRRDAKDMIGALEKESEISKDDSKRGQDELQGITDSFVKKIDEMTANKETEIMEI
ncbi:MAG: ribosome recycling factor [Candidatus Lindowbacteria bacterium]|nr:ribosome recycling factor [Candidatus Lindowbacteria bacterium]